MICTCLLATLSLVPYPVKAAEKTGMVPQDTAVRYETDAKIPAEGYRLTVAADGITVTSSDEAGRFYAGQTLAQLLDPAKKSYPCVEIEDAPAFRWRGMHLDEGRHFFGKDAVKAILDTMAMHKLNVFHWHLTEDQGWRIDVPGHPELVKFGAVRAASPKPEPFKPGVPHSPVTEAVLDGTPYGPYFYTEADLREVVAYAAARHITVVPELDFPGHFYAALVSHPEFACHPENLKGKGPRCIWGIEKDVLCVGNDEAVKFIEELLGYFCRVFPGEYVHIGGDECPQERWKACPKCQARIRAENLGDERGLQPWLTRRVAKFLAERGKRVVGWDEYLLGDIPKSAIGMNWRTNRGGAGHQLRTPAECIAEGRDMVMARCDLCYLNQWQRVKDDFEYSGGNLHLRRCYEFDPCAGIPVEGRVHVLGAQGCNWTEFTRTAKELEWKMWPRGCALAEVFWTGEARPGFMDFRLRMKNHRARLIASGVNCATY